MVIEFHSGGSSHCLKQVILTPYSSFNLHNIMLICTKMLSGQNLGFAVVWTLHHDTHIDTDIFEAENCATNFKSKKKINTLFVRGRSV